MNLLKRGGELARKPPRWKMMYFLTNFGQFNLCSLFQIRPCLRRLARKRQSLPLGRSLGHSLGPGDEARSSVVGAIS